MGLPAGSKHKGRAQQAPGEWGGVGRKAEDKEVGSSLKLTQNLPPDALGSLSPPTMVQYLWCIRNQNP